MPSLSHRTPRESPTLATINSLSDSRATRQVVPAAEEGKENENVEEDENIAIFFLKILHVRENVIRSQSGACKTCPQERKYVCKIFQAVHQTVAERFQFWQSEAEKLTWH